MTDVSQHLPEHRVKELISRFGVHVPAGVTVPSHGAADGDVAGAAADLAAPLVVKAYGPGLVHKSDAGAVRLGIGSAAAAATAAAEMRRALEGQGIEPAGFLVEEQAPTGVEVIVGVVRDPAFGPVLLAGLGGVWTEVLRDTALRLCPITEADAHAMLAELRGGALLDGVRGGPPVDRAALVKVLLAVGGPGGIVEDLGDRLGEFELNPVICGPHGATAVDARLIPPHIPPLTPPLIPPGAPPARSDGAPAAGFGRLFAPRGVAVVGASTKKPNFGNMFLSFYRGAGFGGTLLAVHPTAAEIDGVPCVPSLAEVPDEVDYALVAVPAARCAAVLRDAGARSRPIPYVQVMSGGFREMGEPELEDGLLAAAREAGVRLLGPNCMGVYAPAGGQTFIGGEQGRPGRIAVVSQSGGLAGEVIKVGERRGLAFSKVATVGNSADVTPAELLRYLAGDPDTATIGLYLEDPRDGRGLFEVLREIDTPVAALVGGRSAQGGRAAASHTGGMVTDARLWPALAAQTGIALVASQDDLIGTLDFLDLHGRRRPAGDGVLVIGPSGGASVLAADVFARAGLNGAGLDGACLDGAGLDLPGFPEEAKEALRGLGLGAGSSLANPLEVPVGPMGRQDLVSRAVTAILAHRAYADVVAHVNAQSFFTFGDAGLGTGPGTGSRTGSGMGSGTGRGGEALVEFARVAGELQREHPDVRITLVVRNSECAPPGVEDGMRDAARAAGIPLYRSMEAASVAVSAGVAVLAHGRRAR